MVTIYTYWCSDGYFLFQCNMFIMIIVLHIFDQKYCKVNFKVLSLKPSTFIRCTFFYLRQKFCIHSFLQFNSVTLYFNTRFMIFKVQMKQRLFSWEKTFFLAFSLSWTITFWILFSLNLERYFPCSAITIKQRTTAE